MKKRALVATRGDRHEWGWGSRQGKVHDTVAADTQSRGNSTPYYAVIAVSEEHRGADLSFEFGLQFLWRYAQK